jgi:trehalose/maltose transport system permease protein
MSVRAETRVQAFAAPARQVHSKLVEAQTRLAWILLAPSLIVVAAIALVPLAQTIAQSFTNARLASERPITFVGLNNYVNLFSDTDFLRSIWVTVQFSVITVFFEFILGMVIALVVNSNFKGRGPMRAAMLVPWAIITVVSAQMWKWMYNDIYGVINDFLVDKLHFMSGNLAWVSNPATQLPAIEAIDIWKATPFVALLLLAGLQVIPGDIYEAARVDGANGVQQFFMLTLPLLRPAILVTLIFRTLDALRVFDVFYVMFGSNPTTMPMAVYAQQNIVSFSLLGYGSSVAIAIFLIIGVFVVAYMTILKVETA